MAIRIRQPNRQGAGQNREKQEANRKKKKKHKTVLDTGIQTQPCKEDTEGGFKCTEKDDSRVTYMQ